MEWIETVIAEFGRQVGIQNLTLNSNQRLRLDSDNGNAIGMISLPSLPLPDLVIYLSRPAGYFFEDSQIYTILQIQNFRKARPWQIQSALNGKEFYLGFRIPQRSVSIPTINEAIKLLHNIAENDLQL
jgi:hypothetical protein